MRQQGNAQRLQGPMLGVLVALAAALPAGANGGHGHGGGHGGGGHGGGGAGPGQLCPAGYKQRSAAEVLADHRAWLAAGDIERDVQCNYARDAVVISDQGVATGRDEIRNGLLGLAGLFGGVVPVLEEEIIVSILNSTTEMARVLFSIDTACIDIPDGIDTYVIRRGQIEAQTAHGFPVFHCGPPPPPPAP